jgi:hypothetical protein
LQKDFENSHVPRLRNIIVAPVNPTERLKKWREDHPDRERATPSSSQSSQTPSSNSEIQPITPDYGIGTGARGGDWRLENALFVSSKAQGTRVLHCPSAQELHKKTWNEDFGRGGKLVQERTIAPGEPVSGIDRSPDKILPLKRKKSFADLRSMWSFVDVPVIERIQSMAFVPEKLSSSLHCKFSPHVTGLHSKQASTRKKVHARTRHYNLHPLLGRFASEVKAYEGDPAVRDLPDPDSDIGTSYYSNIPTWPLPPGIYVPSPRFARKHCLVPEEVPLPGGVVIKLVPTADEMAIEKNFNDVTALKAPRSATGLAGPFTPEMFKDSGIDFPRYWGNTEHVPSDGKLEVEALSDMGALGDAAQSPSKSLRSITEGMQASSIPSVLPGSEQRHLPYLLNELSRHPLENWRLGPTASMPKAMESNRRQWRNFTWKRCPEGTMSNTAPATGALCEPRLALMHPLTDLTKAVQQALSEPFHPEQVASSISASLPKERHCLDTLCSPGPYHSKNVTITPAVNCAIMEPANPTQSSTITVNRSCNSAVNGMEADEQSEPSLQMDIPEITANPPAEASKKHSTQTCDPERVSMRNKHQGYKITLDTTRDHLLVEAAFNVLDSAVIEEHAYGKSAVELALEILQWTGYVHSETMLNCGSSGAKKNQRVVNDNNENAEALSKRENNVKISTTDSLEGSPDTSLTLVRQSEELTKRWLNLQKESGMDLNRDLPPLPSTTDLQSLQFCGQSQQHNLESAPECTLELLQPLYYDPVRDSLKYGGVHYHPGGMRYYPEVVQHPPRTSSMPRPGTLLDTTAGAMQHQVEALELPKPSSAALAPARDVLGPCRASDASYSSEASSGIMGNFIPVKTVASPSVIVTRAVRVPRIEYTPFITTLSFCN